MWRFKFVLLPLILFGTEYILLSSTPGEGQHVLYGERELTNKFAVYLDREGNIYPPVFISNSRLSESGFSLSNWYEKHPDQFAFIAKSVGIVGVYSSEKLNQLNDSLVARLVQGWKNEKELNFIVHGFRKSFVQQNEDSTSTAEFLVMENRLKMYLTSPIIRVYWDGMYDCCISKDTKRNKEILEMFQIAQVQAEQAGKGLSRILNQLSCEKVNLISHSLGALVISSTKENTKPVRKHQCNWLFVAPAIDHTALAFDDGSALPFDHLGIIYNHKDFVLKKKDPFIGWFGPGNKKYGNTSLGCNCDRDMAKLKKELHRSHPHFKLDVFDFTSIGKTHKVKAYFGSDNWNLLSDWLKN